MTVNQIQNEVNQLLQENTDIITQESLPSILLLVKIWSVSKNFKTYVHIVSSLANVFIVVKRRWNNGRK